MNARFLQLINIIFLISILFSCSSIKTSTDHYKAIDQQVSQENWVYAASIMDSIREDSYSEKDRVLYWIDYALLNHYAGRDSISLEYFQKAEFAIEELYTKSISKAIGSMFLNDNTLDYFGEDYEDIYINLFMALAYYKMGLPEETVIEIRALNEELAMLEDKNRKLAEAKDNNSSTDGPEIIINNNKFYSSALARYLSMLIYLSEGNISEALIDKEKIHEAFISQSQLYNFREPSLDIYFNRSSKVKVSFLSFVGRSPIKHSWNMKVDSYKNGVSIYVQENEQWIFFEQLIWPGINSGLNIKFSLPKMQKRGTMISKVEVLVNGKLKTNLEPIESIENIAMETYKIKEPVIYLKSIARSIGKAIANEALNKELDKETGGGLLGSLTRIVTSEALGATENADLRGSHYLPSLALVGCIELDEGIYDIQINYKDNYGNIIYSDYHNNHIVKKNSGKNFFESVCLN